MLEPGFEYNIDGDKVDKRNQIINEQRQRIASLTGLQLRENMEARLREKYPGLQELYDQYQTMLALVQESERRDDTVDACNSAGP